MHGVFGLACLTYEVGWSQDVAEQDLVDEYEGDDLKKDREEGKNKLRITTEIMKDRQLQMTGRMMAEVAEPFMQEYLEMLQLHSAGQESSASWQGNRALRMWMGPVLGALKILSRGDILSRLELGENTALDDDVRVARIIELFDIVLGVVSQRCLSQWGHHVKVGRGNVGQALVCFTAQTQSVRLPRPSYPEDVCNGGNNGLGHACPQQQTGSR